MAELAPHKRRQFKETQWKGKGVVSEGGSSSHPKPWPHLLVVIKEPSGHPDTHIPQFPTPKYLQICAK